MKGDQKYCKDLAGETMLLAKSNKVRKVQSRCMNDVGKWGGYREQGG